MRTFLVSIILLITIIACRKQSNISIAQPDVVTTVPYDERDEIIGKYEGIRISSYLPGNSRTILYDTTDVFVNIIKSNKKNTIIVESDSYENFYEFVYKHKSFSSVAASNTSISLRYLNEDVLHFENKTANTHNNFYIKKQE